MGVRTITIVLTGESAGLTRTLTAASGQIDRFVADTKRKGGAVGDFLGSNLGKGVAAGAAALAVGLGTAVAAAVPFEAAMRNVNSIAGESEAAFAASEQAVLNLSKTLPQSATTLANGLYEIQSSGFQAADALHVLEVSGRAATAGLTDTDTASKAIAGALNAYGLSAASAGDVSDILFQTVNKGVVSFGELSQQLGDFVGTAAAAKVPLQDVSAAYAAITLSGIPAAQAATSVNQTLVALLKPSKDMQGAFKALGYESGAAALQQRGLQRVIEDIGKVTGGSSDQIIRLFQNVEASRGVLALLAADGKNYQSAVDGIGNAEARTGATQRAFTEQMKSTQAQLRLLVNGAEAFGIQVGLKVLPPLNAFLTAARDAGGDALPFLEAALQRVGPLFEQVWNIAGNLARIIAELARDAAPFAQVLAQIGAAVVVAPLQLFLGVLSSLTGFLADHRGVVEAVAAVYLARLIPALVASGVQAGIAAGRTLLAAVAMRSLDAAALGANGALTAVGTSAGLASIALTAGLAAAIFAVVRGIGQWNDAQDAAKRNADQVRASFDAYDTTKAQQQLEQLRQTAQRGIDTGREYDGVWGTFKAGFSEVFGDGQVGKVAAEGEQAAQAYNDLNKKLENTAANLSQVALQTGMSSDALGRLASQQNIDLSGTFDSSADARKRLIDYVNDLDHASATTAANMAANLHLDVEAAQELEKALQKVVDAATTAFRRDTDVLGDFDPAGDAKKVADAQEALAKARRSSTSSGSSSLRDEQRIARDRQAIQDAEARAAVSHSKSQRSHLSDQQSINRARRKLADDEAALAARGTGGGRGGQQVADAQDRLAQAKADQADNSLRRRYERARELSRNFIADINTAIQRGLDPAVVQRLLEEGPAKAEPVLRSILRDHTGNMVALVNSSETEIGKFSEFVAEQARLTAIAVQHPTDEFTRELKTAMAIAAQEAATGGRATVAQLAGALRTSEANIRKVAQDFGITLAQQVEGAVRANGPIVVRAEGVIEFSPSFGKDPNKTGREILRQLAGGTPTVPRPRGPIRKPRDAGGPIDWGPFGRDQVFTGLTRGEWVTPKASVDFYGQGLLEAIRTRTLPRGYWDGGLVGASGALVSSVLNVAGPRIVPVPVPVASRSSTDNSQTFNIDRVVVGSFGDVPAATGGGRTYSATKGVS